MRELFDGAQAAHPRQKLAISREKTKRREKLSRRARAGAALSRSSIAKSSRGWDGWSAIPQKLTRHSRPELTMNIYTKLDLQPKADAVGKLAPLPAEFVASFGASFGCKR